MTLQDSIQPSAPAIAEDHVHRVSATEVVELLDRLLRAWRTIRARPRPGRGAAAGFAERRYQERLAIVADHLVAVGAIADAARAGQILWFHFGPGGPSVATPRLGHIDVGDSAEPRLAPLTALGLEAALLVIAALARR
jgi:hypothetical protein